MAQTAWHPNACGCGVYLFQGIRRQGTGAITTVRDLVQVGWQKVGQQGSYYVVYFGRETRYRLETFEGQWLKLIIDYEGEGRSG